MRTFARALLVSSSSLVVACGGRIDGETAFIPSSAEADDELAPSGPEDGEWGTWQLLSVDGPDGRRHYDPPFVELDLHPNGQAFMWTCSVGPPTGQGERCPFYARHGCLVGTIALEGDIWRVHFPTKDGMRTAARGDVVDEPSGDITVKGEGALHPGGHYRRVGAATREGCEP